MNFPPKHFKALVWTNHSGEEGQSQYHWPSNSVSTAAVKRMMVDSNQSFSWPSLRVNVIESDSSKCIGLMMRIPTGHGRLQKHRHTTQWYSQYAENEVLKRKLPCIVSEYEHSGILHHGILHKTNNSVTDLRRRCGYLAVYSCIKPIK